MPIATIKKKKPETVEEALRMFCELQWYEVNPSSVASLALEWIIDEIDQYNIWDIIEERREQRIRIRIPAFARMVAYELLRTYKDITYDKVKPCEDVVKEVLEKSKLYKLLLVVEKEYERELKDTREEITHALMSAYKFNVMESRLSEVVFE